MRYGTRRKEQDTGGEGREQGVQHRKQNTGDRIQETEYRRQDTVYRDIIQRGQGRGTGHKG